MAKILSKEINAELQIKAIEILNSSLNLPANSDTSIVNFNFNIGIESHADMQKKLVFVIVRVEVKNDDESVVLATLAVSNIFEITNMSEVVQKADNGNIDIPDRLMETLNIISISTLRGIMFSTFRGTFLHGAVLPIIDPKLLQDHSQKVTL